MISSSLTMPRFGAVPILERRDEHYWQQHDQQRQWFAYALPGVMMFLLALVPVLRTGAKWPFALVLLPALLWTSLRDTERALYIYIAWCWMDGTIRGIFGGLDLMAAARDAVLLLILVGWGIQRAHTRSTDAIRKPPGRLLIGLFVFSVLLEIFNPYNGGLLRTLAGLKIHLAPIPLFFVSYDVFRRRRQVRSLFIFLTLATVVISAVSFVQYVEGKNWTYAHFPGTQQVISQNYNPTIGVTLTKDATFKPPGTTGFGGATGLFAGFIFPLAFVLLQLTGPLRLSRWMKLAFVLVLLSFIVALFINGVRSGMAEAIAGTLLCTILVGGHLRIRALTVTMVCLVLGTFGFLISQNITHGGAAVRYASFFADPNSALHADRRTFIDELPNLLYHSSLGIGLGSTGAASGHLGPHYGLGFTPYSECYLGCMILDTGVIGASLITIITLFFIWRGFHAVKNVSSPDDRLLAMSMVAMLVLFLANFVVQPVLYNLPGSVLFWLFGAILLRVYGLPQEVAEARFAAPSL